MMWGKKRQIKLPGFPEFSSKISLISVGLVGLLWLSQRWYVIG